ncbi:MAG: helix-turn-helix domain-containing protein [Spirochaetota bacterium]|nr:helix-turn-helix domain-containing protein [Spirochaetota bacterium]
MSKQYYKVITIIILFFLCLAIAGNSFFQSSFFSERWKLPLFWVILFLILENGAKIIIELSSFIIFNIIQGKNKYIVFIIMWSFLFMLISFGILQSFSTRTYLSQVDSRVEIDKIKRDKLSLMVEKRERLISLYKADLDKTKYQESKLRLIDKAISKVKNQWIIHDFSNSIKKDNLNTDKINTNLVSIEKQLGIVDRDIELLKLESAFTYNTALINAIEGNIPIWDTVADLGITLTLEGLIFILALSLSLLWKDEILGLGIFTQNNKKNALLKNDFFTQSSKKDALPANIIMEGSSLKRIRQENKLSKQDFASLLELSFEALSKFEDGTQTIPPSVIRRLKDLKTMRRIN